jgi:hypothetical protein
MSNLNPQQFGDEASSTLHDLGYSDDEIHATHGQLPPSMATEDKLRLSLRALDAHNTERVQHKVEANTTVAANPKLFDKQERPSTNPDEEYARGRRDERFLKRNDPSYVKPQKEPRPPRPPTARQQRQALVGKAQTLGKLARMAKGSKRR